jgi:hypothetical protein
MQENASMLLLEKLPEQAAEELDDSLDLGQALQAFAAPASPSFHRRAPAAPGVRRSDAWHSASAARSLEARAAAR